MLATGLYGIENKLELEDEFCGNVYLAESIPEIIITPGDATLCFDESAKLRSAFGDEVIDHYVHAARYEQFEYDRHVTDWEVALVLNAPDPREFSI